MALGLRGADFGVEEDVAGPLRNSPQQTSQGS